MSTIDGGHYQPRIPAIRAVTPDGYTATQIFLSVFVFFVPVILAVTAGHFFHFTVQHRFKTADHGLEIRFDGRAPQQSPCFLEESRPFALGNPAQRFQAATQSLHVDLEQLQPLAFACGNFGKPFKFGDATRQGRNVKSIGNHLAGKNPSVTLPVRAVAATNEIGLDEVPDRPTQCPLGQTVQPLSQRLIARKHNSVAGHRIDDAIRMEAQELFEHVQCGLLDPHDRSGLAKKLHRCSPVYSCGPGFFIDLGRFLVSAACSKVTIEKTILARLAWVWPRLVFVKKRCGLHDRRSIRGIDLRTQPYTECPLFKGLQSERSRPAKLQHLDFFQVLKH